MVLPAMMACGEQTTATPADTDAADTDGTAAADIKLFYDAEDKSDYVIVYPAESELYSTCFELKGMTYAVRSVSLWPKKDTEVDAGEYEIIVGKTNRPESQELLATIADGEYAIKAYGKKIVIAAHTEDDVTYAVEEFIKMYVADKKDNVILPADLSVKGKVPSEFELLEAGWTFKKFTDSNKTELPYQIYIPNDLDATKEYPVILFMHGLGSVGTDGSHIKSEVAQFVKNVVASEYKDDVIIVAPQHPSGQKWVDVSFTSGTYSFDKTPMSKYMKAAVELFDVVFEELPVDTDRVYGYGNSMGAFATIYLAMTYPDLYAAIVPVAGGCDPTKASLIKDVPIWLFHGDADTTVNYIGSKTLADNLTALGASNVKITIYPGINHATKGCFVAAANTEGLLEWMFSQSKSN